MVVIGFKGFIVAKKKKKKKKNIAKTTLFYYISICHFLFDFIFCGLALMFRFLSLSSILIYIFCLILIAYFSLFVNFIMNLRK
jgi:hypothetical protein